MAARRFIVISNARSGSNQLVNYINQMPGCRCLGEVLKDHFLVEKGWEPTARRLGDPEAVRELHQTNLTEFWNRLAATHDADADWVGAKIFYKHRVGDPIWETFFDPEMPVIHLWRRRLFDTFMSLVVAESTGEWKSQIKAPAGEGPKQKIQFPVQRYLTYREGLQKAFRMVNARLADHKQVMHIEYEEIGKPAELSGRLAEFFGTEARLKATLRKQMTGSPLDLLSNPEAAAPFVDDFIDQDFSS